MGKGQCLGLVLLLAMAVGLGCGGGSYIPSGPVVHPQDGAIQDQPGQGLALKILSFDWRYLKPTDQIKVTGWAENLSGRRLQGCRLIVNAFDQFNYPLGAAETFLDPTVIPPGQKARFDFYLERGSWVKALHLRYRFETRY